MYITKLLEDHWIPTNIDINERLWTGRFRTNGTSLRFIRRSRFLYLYFRSGQTARSMRITRARAHKTSEKSPIFRPRKFCLAKKEKSLDLQVYGRISKTIKKLYWITNTIVKNSSFVRFWCLYIWWCQNCFIYPWIGKHLILLWRRSL